MFIHKSSGDGFQRRTLRLLWDVQSGAQLEIKTTAADLLLWGTLFDIGRVCWCTSSEQSFVGPSPAGLVMICCGRLETTPVRRARRPQRNTVSRLYLQVKSKWYHNWWSVGQSVFESGTHVGPETIIILSIKIIFRQLWISTCEKPSLTKSLVCSLTIVAGPRQPQYFSRQSPAQFMTIVLLAQIWDSPNFESIVSLFIFLSNKQTPWPLVRERTIPTERSPLVDEI
jgi:hypothetical protein